MTPLFEYEQRIVLNQIKEVKITDTKKYDKDINTEYIKSFVKYLGNVESLNLFPDSQYKSI